MNGRALGLSRKCPEPVAVCVSPVRAGYICSTISECLCCVQAPNAAVSVEGMPFERQSCDLEGSGLEKLRRFSADRGANVLDPVPEDNACAGDQNTSNNSQPEYYMLPTTQSSAAAGALSLSNCCCRVLGKQLRLIALCWCILLFLRASV